MRLNLSHDGNPMLQLESERLYLREATESDLPAFLPVYLTNRRFLSWSNLCEYDLAALRRDWEVVQQTPGRCLLGIYRKDSNEAVGVADFLEQNQGDGFPWLGLLIIHGSQQGQGLGREAFQCLVAHFQTDRGWVVLRLSVLRENRPALAFWRHLGFRTVEDGTGTADAATIRLERHLREEDRSQLSNDD